ncbi:FAD/NAD(P)-binding protein [Glutamicibacter sp.]|uniref:FAD/NAD(P)-binding protein n=1 Tax=Glutamicibacter sp. TaxID=1931995 RepID=UPI003D6B5B0B
MTRIAMIGGGPKCLYALLELNDSLPQHLAGEIQVDVYDPYPPGAGRVWNTGQPRELKLNVNPRIIDASSSLCSQDFNQWQETKNIASVDGSFPARALVGEYLSEQFQRLAEHGSLQIAHRPCAVERVARRGPHWEVRTVQGAELYDEVVLVTGHGLGGYRAEDSPRRSISAAALTVEHDQAEDDTVLSGSKVVIRGAALTAYDVVLRLTEGRGGSWESTISDGLEFLHYIPSGEEPASITMTSRSGIPMTPKPNTRPASAVEVLDGYRDQVRRWGIQRHGTATGGELLHPGLDELWQILLSCAMECAKASGSETDQDALWKILRTGYSEQMAKWTSAAEQLRASVRINHGLATPSTQWVWGTVWSGLYPQLVDALSRISWNAGEREQFKTFAANLERMAFGPPEPTALKLLALFEAGLLHHEQSTSDVLAEADLTIDAVTAPAGVRYASSSGGDSASSLFSDLLAEGDVQVRAGERGLLTDKDGTCLDSAGERNESLAALGRPTEDPTLGHDTLNRGLHLEYRGWARRIARQVAASQQKVAQ